MGQKINPTGFRLAVNRDWASKWYANTKHFASTLNEDVKVRDYLRKKLTHASVGKITIERPAKNARITIHSARPGVVIGKKGAKIIKRVLESAIANAEHNEGADIDELKITTIYIDKAANLRRFTARAKGRGNVILKQTCHIHVTVGNGK